MKEYKGIWYEKEFGKVVKNLDREQTRKNEKMKQAFFKQRKEELTKTYDKIFQEKLAENGLKQIDQAGLPVALTK